MLLRRFPCYVPTQVTTWQRRAYNRATMDISLHSKIFFSVSIYFFVRCIFHAGFVNANAGNAGDAGNAGGGGGGWRFFLFSSGNYFSLRASWFNAPRQNEKRE